MIKKLLNQKGSSLMQVVIAGGLVTMIGTGSYKMIQSQMRAQKMINQNLIINNFTDTIRTILYNESTCTANFAGSPLSGSNSTNKSITRGSEVFNDGPDTQSLGGGVTIENIELENDNGLSGAVTGDVDVVLTLNRTIGNSTATVTKRVPISVELNTSTRIVNCQGKLDQTSENRIDTLVTQALEQMCTSMSGTFDTTTKNCTIDYSSHVSCPTVPAGPNIVHLTTVAAPAPTPTPRPVQKYRCPSRWGACGSSCQGQTGTSSRCYTKPRLQFSTCAGSPKQYWNCTKL